MTASLDLVVFDVDGTLTATGALDAQAYARSFRLVYGVDLPTTDWVAYACPTDRGIAEESVRRLGLDAARIPELRARFGADYRDVAGFLAALREAAVPGSESLR